MGSLVQWSRVQKSRVRPETVKILEQNGKDVRQNIYYKIEKCDKMFKICLPAGPDFSGIGRFDP
jgi:hypothetical protein